MIEMQMDSGICGDAVEIDRITDVHFNYVSISGEDDREAMATGEKRK